MLYVDQTEFISIENGTKGNCLSACLANLLNIDLATIPNFAALGAKWHPIFSEVLKVNTCEFQYLKMAKMLHDPHPDRTVLLSLKYAFMIEREIQL